MYHSIGWEITIGKYILGLIDSVEVHRSVDLLADTCKITAPGSVYGRSLRVEEKIKPGNKVEVKMGYDGDLRTEFTGYLQRIDTDDGSLVLNCEDELYLLRKDVKDKEMLKTTVGKIAEYLLEQTGASLTLNCTLTIDYDKFVISRATAFDVLKKLKEETKGNIYIRNGVLNIHPPYTETHGYVNYSFQKNIESSDLKYRRKEDRKIEVVVHSTGADGKKLEVTAGTTGGDKVSVEARGMGLGDMQKKAEYEHSIRSYDGYEGSITGWLIPWVDKGYSANIRDEDYEYKDGSYYVTAVTTTLSGSGGGVRKVQLGIHLNNSKNGQVRTTR